MKVLYDSQAFDMQSHGGVSRCFAELYAHLPQDIEAQISVLETDNVYLQALGFPPSGTIYDRFLCEKDSKLKYILFKLCYNVKYGAYNRWNRKPKINKLESAERIKEGDFDLFHPTFFDPFFLRHIGNKPFVMTVHDMIPELYPQYYGTDHSQIRHKQLTIPGAAHIIAVSEQTKMDLCRIMGIKEDKVSVVYHGADESPYTPSPANNRNYEYILYVGERHFYKNFDSFARCCVPILKRHKDMKVVCTGKPFTEEEKAMFESWGLADAFVQTFVKGNQEMLDLYHGATAFVYPSSYEGFGIPILEAYKAGCPVMLNRASCFPEIAGDAAVYFNINDESSNFEEQFETFYHMDGNEKKALIEKQNKRLKRYSWTKSAQQLADIYKEIGSRQ